MSLFDKPLSALDISASGLTAAKVKMGVIASNIANAQVTETPGGGPYKRKEVEFATVLSKSMIGGSSMKEMKLNGVKIKGVTDSGIPPVMVHRPGHPHANEEGFVSMPNVSIAKEMIDMIFASRSYEANTSVISALRRMNDRALDIIRR
jgi:flagellar basal-body rod protein FlgC